MAKKARMIPVMLGLGSLLTKVAAAAVVPRIVKALSALGGPPEPIRANPSQDAQEPGSEFAPEREKSLYGRKPLLRHTRAYDAANKRWISRDPLGEGVDYNLYRYCGNSPINFSDPSGLDVSIDGREYFVNGVIAELMLLDLTQAGDHSVHQIDIVGHAGGDRAMLSMKDRTGEQGLLKFEADGKLHLYQGGKGGYGPEIEGFDALLRRKLAPGAKINFYGCHSDDLAKKVNKSYSVSTMGTPEYTWNPGRGIPSKLPNTSVDLPSSWEWKDVKQGHIPGTWNRYGR